MADRTVRVSLTAQVSGYLAGMEKARKATSEVGDAAEQASKQAEAQEQAMDAAGKGLAAVGVVAGAAAAIAVKAAIDWQSAWAGVTKTVDGTPEQLQEVEDGLRSLAKTLPSTHDEIAGVAEAAGQLGVARKDVVGFTKTMVDLSETTNLTADEAATSIAQISNVMGTMGRDGAEGVERFGATLVALGNAGASTEAEILEMAKRIAGAAKLVGASESDVLALANAMASVGIEAQLGGGVMSRVMQRMYGDVMTGGEALDNLAKVAGVSSKEFATAFETDPVRAVDMMVKGLGRVKDEGGNVVETMDTLGMKGTEETGVILRLAGAGDLLADSLKLGDKAWESNSALAEEAAKRYATVESKLQVTANKVSDAAISFGEVLLPAVTAASDGVGALADGLGALDPFMQGTLVSAVLVGGAVSLAGGAFLLALPKIAAYHATLAVLSTSTMPAVAASAQMMTAATARSGAALAATAKFMTGPWGVALAAAAAGGYILASALDAVQASSEEVENSLATAKSAAEVLAVVGEGKEWKWLYGAKEQLKDLTAVLQASADQSEDVFARFDSTHFGAFDALKEVGGELAKISASDLPAAQRAFRMFADETDGSAEAQWRLLNAMGPEYMAALLEVASAADVNVTSSDQAKNKTNLLRLAFGDAAPVAETAAEAYLSAADEASALADEVLKLTDLMNAANDVGSDAVTSNANYQASLAGISDEVARQKEEFIKLQEDAYEEANGSLDGFVGTLDGFTLSLDESTAAGSANAAMLTGVADDARAAALAQFEVDKTTMNAKDATDQYNETLAVSKQALADQAAANGYSAEEVQKLIDKVYALPDQKAVQILADAAAASSVVDEFVRKLNNIPGQRDVVINQVVRETGAARGAVAAAYASGGAVFGPGTSTSDSIPALLSDDEHVLTAADVGAMGGHANVYAFRKSLHRGYAGGGEVGFATQPQYVQSGHTPGGKTSSVVRTREGDTWNISTPNDPALVASMVESRQTRKEWSDR